MDVSADSARASTPTDTNATPPGTPPSGPQTTAGDAERGGGAKRRVPPGGAVEEGDGTPDMKRAATTADDEDDTPTRRERQYMDEKVEKEVERKEGRQRGKELDGGGRSGDGGAAVTREQHSDATVTTAAAAVSEEVMVHDPLDAFDSDMHEEAPEIYFPAEKGCRSIDVYERLNMIDEGTYGVVFRVKDTSTGEVLAVKRLKMEAEREGFPITSLREINTLLKAKHENVVNVKEIVTGHTMNDIFICMEFVEHDLKSLLETMKQPLLHAEVKMLMQQLLQGVHHLHDNWIIHRDLKTSNLLLSHRGVLKIADFGLAREFGSPLKVMTQMVVTLWYRAPELLLGAKKYTAAIDLWSVGCIFAELITTKALFPGKGEIDTIKKIFTLLGTPSEEIWDGYNDLPAVQKVHFAKKHGTGLINEFGNILNRSGLDLLSKLLTYDPARRISAADSVEHAWFRDYPPPTEPELFPHYPARAEGHQRRRHDSPSAPVGGHMNEEERELYMLMKESRPSGFNLKFG